jgi:hypothetical protein
MIVVNLDESMEALGLIRLRSYLLQLLFNPVRLVNSKFHKVC